MRRCRETPDWWISTRSTMSPTACSPPRRASTIRRRVGSARVWKRAECMMVHMHTSAYEACPARPCAPAERGRRQDASSRKEASHSKWLEDPADAPSGLQRSVHLAGASELSREERDLEAKAQPQRRAFDRHGAARFLTSPEGGCAFATWGRRHERNSGVFRIAGVADGSSIPVDLEWQAPPARPGSRSRCHHKKWKTMTPAKPFAMSSVVVAALVLFATACPDVSPPVRYLISRAL